MEDKQHITIHIADASPLHLNIKRDNEEMARKIANNINMMWSQWCDDFKDKSSKDILAMVAFRYAQVYYELLASVNANEASMAEAEKALDDILLNLK